MPMTTQGTPASAMEREWDLLLLLSLLLTGPDTGLCFLELRDEGGEKIGAVAAKIARGLGLQPKNDSH